MKNENVFKSRLKEFGGGFLPPRPQIEFLYRIIVHCDPPINIGTIPGKPINGLFRLPEGDLKAPNYRVMSYQWGRTGTAVNLTIRVTVL